MATPRPTAPAEEAQQPSLFVGTFVDVVARGYLEPTGAELAQIQQMLKVQTQEAGTPRSFWNDLYTIKLLAPEESKDLIIFAHERAYPILEKIAKALVFRYYQQGRR